MDLEKIKRFADSQYEGWKIAKAVTEVKNEIKNAEQGRDIAMSDVFKTLREPLIEQQKKTDAKQDAVIEQLRENQLALTGGLKDLVESNRDGFDIATRTSTDCNSLRRRKWGNSSKC